MAVGQSLRLISVEEIDFPRSDEKFTLVAWRGHGGKASDGLIRTPLKELLTQLDPTQFVQVHRSVVVNLRAISLVTRGLNETGNIAKAKVAGSNGARPERLTRSCPNSRGLMDPHVDSGGLPRSHNFPERLKS